MQNKFLISLLALSSISCGINTKNKTNLINSNSKIELNNYKMELSNTCNEFVHIATINSSEFNNHKLQATGLVKKNNIVYITYNTQYDEVRGGLDIISLSSSNVPSLLASLVSENSEFADIKMKDNYLFLVGQKKLADQSTKALLTVVDISNNQSPTIVSELEFNGYYATSLDIQLNKAYISVPNLGIVSIDISNPLSPSIIETLGSNQGNTLFVKRAGLNTIQLGGDNSHNLMNLDQSNNILYQRWLFSQTQEAPSRFAIKDNFLYTNGGNSGLTILKDYNLGIQNPVYSSSFSTYIPQQGTGNGLALGSCNKLYQAMGENGVLVSDISIKSSPIQLGSFDYNTDSGSANNVFFIQNNNSKLIFVADGLAGIKIINVQNNCDCNTDKVIVDDNESNSHEGLICNVYDLNITKPSNLPNFDLLTPVGSFKASKLDVINQTYSNSFPLFPNELKYLKEWYGISCKGYMNQVSTETANIELSSDDGAILYVDDVKLIDNDGLHSPALKTVQMNLTPKAYKIRLDYMQGPQTQINLELKKKIGTSASTYINNFFN